jgi:hypothetical protein
VNVEKLEQGRSMIAARLDGDRLFSTFLNKASLFDIGQAAPHDRNGLASVSYRYLTVSDIGGPFGIFLDF